MTDGTAYFTFRAGGRRCGIPAAAVREVAAGLSVRPVPSAPPWCAGVAALRGTLLPVVDVRRRLGLAVPAEAGAARLVVVECRGERAALAVDEPGDLLDPGGARPEPAADADARAVTGVLALPDGLMLALDPDALIYDQEVSP